MGVISYEPPGLAWSDAGVQVEPVVLWTISLGWITTATLLAYYAARCHAQGGSTSLSWGWSGLKLVCSR
jgi:hypothetical protein